MLPLVISTWFMLAALVRDAAGSQSFAGTNNYYLHGLSAQDQAEYIQKLQMADAKVVRLWVTGIKSTCTKSSPTVEIPNYEVTLGTYETELLDAIDNVLIQLHSAGIKAIISPHDANLLPPNGTGSGYNGIDIYGTTYGSSFSFYTDAAPQAHYDARLTSILNYVSPHFNKSWANLPEVIMAFDLQNEPMIASPDLLQRNDPADWLCSRATLMHYIIGDSGVAISTGGIGGSQFAGHDYNLLERALNCPAIDIMAVHGYMSTQLQWTPYVPELAQQAAEAGKLCMWEEWGVSTDPDNDSVVTQAQLLNDNGIPWLYWMLIAGKSVDQACVPDDDGLCCHEGLSTDLLYDFEIGFESSRADFGTLFREACQASALQDWSMYLS